jgi:hypothetical protein
MSIIGNHIAYLKDNPERYWFKRKLYGWGWTPARWQGWLVIGVFILLIVADFSRIDATQHSGSDTLLNFAPNALVLVLVLIGICYKTGESPRWQWGTPKKD